MSEYPSCKSDYGEIITLTATNGFEKHDFVIAQKEEK